MTRKEYFDKILKSYSLVSTLSNKNNSLVLRLRNRSNNKDLVMRSYDTPILAYDKLCNIKHDNLPIIYDAITLEDGQIVLEEFIDGITVADVMESGQYKYSGTRKVLRSVCYALQLLHELGFVHRDVKPENIMIHKDGRVILIDFNTTRKISKADKDTVVMGTVGYASPEQLGVTQSDARTDIYAVGVTLNVMITGKHPSEEFAKGKAGRIVTKCTNINPDKRYQSAEQLIKLL